jgi:AmmeMemoRadiSam system protein B
MNLRPSIAGMWYPADADALRRELDRMLGQVPPSEPAFERLMALVVPHAGHRYSGQVAAYGFSTVRGTQPDRLIVIGPLHRYHDAALLTSAHDGYQTPLGVLPIDRELADRISEILLGSWGLELATIARDSEHSIEVELPFVQAVIGDRPFVPLMISDQRREVVRRLAAAIAQALGNDTALIVASSDLSHYYPQSTAESLDREMLARIERLDPEAVLRAESEGVGFACGRGAIAAALWVSAEQGARTARILRHATSGDVTGDFSAVVGYGAVAIGQAGRR